MSRHLSDVTGEPLEFEFAGANYPTKADMLGAIVRAFLRGCDVAASFSTETDEALSAEIFDNWGLGKSQLECGWDAEDLTAAVADYRAEVAAAVPVSDLARKAVALFVRSYGDNVFGDLLDDGELADQLLADKPMARHMGDLKAQGVKRAQVAAAFSASRADVTAAAARLDL